MITLNFEVNDRYLIAHTIENYRPNKFVSYYTKEQRKNIINFQEKAWNKSTILYKLVSGDYAPMQYALLNNCSYEEIGKRVDDFINFLLETQEFIRLREETQTTLPVIKKEWDKNYAKTSEYIKSLGINIEGNYRVVITHPGLKTGWYLNENTINWSYQTYFENYNTLYLWHEILHSYFESYDYTHAIIELAVDEQMRVELNGGSYPPYMGHYHLTAIKDKGLEEWKKYLKAEDKNMQKLIETFKNLLMNKS